jgi:DNA-binding Xre family transcriptional regulator
VTARVAEPLLDAARVTAAWEVLDVEQILLVPAARLGQLLLVDGGALERGPGPPEDAVDGSGRTIEELGHLHGRPAEYGREDQYGTLARRQATGPGDVAALTRRGARGRSGGTDIAEPMVAPARRRHPGLDFKELHHDALRPRSRDPGRGRGHRRTEARCCAVGGFDPVKWNLRLAAANRGIWKASELRRLLAERGIEMSTGKLSGLWSGHPNVLRPEELDAFCAVLDCNISELIVAEPEKTPAPRPLGEQDDTAVGHSDAGGPVRSVTPRRRSGRSLPPR